MHTRARRLISAEQSLRYRPDEPVDQVITRALQIIASCIRRSESLSDDQLAFLIDVLTNARYELVEERFSAEGENGDYCTLIASALSMSPLASVLPEELHSSVAALATCLRIPDWESSPQAAAKASWFKQTLWNLSAARDLLVPEALECYQDCVIKALGTMVATERGSLQQKRRRRRASLEKF